MRLQSTSYLILSPINLTTPKIILRPSGLHSLRTTSLQVSVISQHKLPSVVHPKCIQLLQPEPGIKRQKLEHLIFAIRMSRHLFPPSLSVTV